MMLSQLGDLFSSLLKVNCKDRHLCYAQTDVLRVSNKQALQKSHERNILKR